MSNTQPTYKKVKLFYNICATLVPKKGFLN